LSAFRGGVCVVTGVRAFAFGLAIGAGRIHLRTHLNEIRATTRLL
jgi:hypothetical protein